MKYSESIITEAKNALTKELGSVTKILARGITQGTAIQNNLWRMNQKISAGVEIGISKAKPLNQIEDFESLAKEISPLMKLSYNSPILKNAICEIIKKFFIEKIGLENEFTDEMIILPRNK